MQISKYILTLLIISSLYACNSNQDKDDIANSTKDKVDQRGSEFNDTRQKAAEFIRENMENTLPGERIQVMDIPLYSSVLIPNFYTEHAFMPMWIKHPDSLQLAIGFTDYLVNLKYHGLVPAQYHFDTIQSLLEQLKNEDKKRFDAYTIARIDFLLSDAFFMVSSHLYNGKVNPESLNAEWGIQRNKPDLMLDKKLAKLVTQVTLNDFMEQFYPPHPGYKTMVKYAEMLEQKLLYDSIELTIPNSKLTLHVLEDTLYNEAILNRLNFLGYTKSTQLNYADSLSDLFTAIKKLQKEHGLNSDGAIGRNTYNALIETLENKQKKLYVNMERLRWMSDSLEEYYILVNIADFTLDYMHGMDTLIHMRTVVGKEYRQTPVFQGTMTYLVFSPTWTVPPGILRADVLPAVAKNVNYLAQKNMIVLDNSGNRIDPAKIDWQKAKKGSFPYRIRQQPGKQNALGKVKFMFPNKYNVYLHDTPSRELFGRDARTFSSGCIRVEKPYELAKLLLEKDDRWTDDKIKNAMAKDNEQSVILKDKVGVYIYYLTSWGLANGEVHFREDIYQRDDEVWKSLQKSKNY